MSEEQPAHGGFTTQYSPPLAERIWRGLGFRRAFVHVNFDDARTSMVTDIVTHWSLGDRLRLLLTGVSHTQCRIYTDVEVAEAQTVAETTVIHQ